MYSHMAKPYNNYNKCVCFQREEDSEMKAKNRIGNALMAVVMIMFISALLPVRAYARDNGGDTTPPYLTNAVISNVSGSGYDVSCFVRDVGGVSKVLFPTWTEKNGQDDIIWYEGEYYGSRYICHVDIKDHKKEQGSYVTHIYAYDNAGNYTGYALNPITIDDSKNIDTSKFPDVRNTPVDFAQFYGKDPSAFRGMPGFTEIATSEESGIFRYCPENDLWWVFEMNYDHNRIYLIYIKFYASDIPYGTNFRLWGLYNGQPAADAERCLAEHGFDCFYYQPSMWQWKDDGTYMVDVYWNDDGTLDAVCLQPTWKR